MHPTKEAKFLQDASQLFTLLLWCRFFCRRHHAHNNLKSRTFQTHLTLLKTMTRHYKDLTLPEVVFCYEEYKKGLVQGLTRKEISKNLNVSYRSIETIIKRGLEATFELKNGEKIKKPPPIWDVDSTKKKKKEWPSSMLFEDDPVAITIDSHQVNRSFI